MKSFPKLVRRFIGILLLSTLLLIFINLFALFMIGANQVSNGSPWKTAEETANSLSRTENGFTLSEEIRVKLNQQNAWAILIDDKTQSVIWQTKNLPKSIPLNYTISDIAALTRGYIDDFPTFTGSYEDGLVVVGYPKESYWKHMWPSWDYNLIAHLPQTILKVIVCNVILIFLIYIITNTRLLRSVNPIVEGIQNLPTEKQIHVKEKGVLSEIAANINRTSDILQAKNRQLQKKETARANWIAGVSHDIRTPLSMVMGYAGQLESDTHLTEDERKKTTVILRQSEKIKNLINDLNLASKLEYNMQPIKLKKENIIALIRQVVVDFINMDIETKYPIEWTTADDLVSCIINADKDLLKRAVNNLIQNCINHNEDGCHIYVSVHTMQGQCCIKVEDDGISVTDEQIAKLNNTPHYMICDENTSEQRHGLGLLIVKQIIASHNGKTIIQRSLYGGFAVTMILPL